MLNKQFKKHGGAPKHYGKVPERSNGLDCKSSASASEVRILPFPPRIDLVTQLVEYYTFNVRAMGSSPIGVTNALRHGVVVTLRILVPSSQVRILMPQQIKETYSNY